ncbi:unnamed protein product [Gongylonema pulchrum]|uniref:Cyclin_C domain-containing protein n=1 Tax=Gongylonema pulchrum TaxID=637853 RepID=A0A183EAX8_9BILA|nr:unnamed protein product [Gongylonema pulchrum]
MIEAFHGDFDCPLSYRFLRRFARVAEKDMRTLTLARYILETSLLFYEFISVPDSMMAAAALLLAIRMIRAGHWVAHYSFLKELPQLLRLPEAATEAHAISSAVLINLDDPTEFVN